MWVGKKRKQSESSPNLFLKVVSIILSFSLKLNFPVLPSLDTRLWKRIFPAPSSHSFTLFLLSHINNKVDFLWRLFPKKREIISFYLDGVRSVNTSQLAIATMCWCVRCEAEWNLFLNAECSVVDIESAFRHCHHENRLKLGGHYRVMPHSLLLDLPKTVGSIKTCMTPQAGKALTCAGKFNLRRISPGLVDF